MGRPVRSGAGLGSGHGVLLACQGVQQFGVLSMGAGAQERLEAAACAPASSYTRCMVGIGTPLRDGCRFWRGSRWPSLSSNSPELRSSGPAVAVEDEPAFPRPAGKLYPTVARWG